MINEYPIIRAYNGDVRQNIMLLFSKSNSIRDFANFFRQIHIDSGNFKEYFRESFIGEIPGWFSHDGLYDLRERTLFKRQSEYAGKEGIRTMSFDFNGISYHLETILADLDPEI
jgi:hypothetical protein